MSLAKDLRDEPGPVGLELSLPEAGWKMCGHGGCRWKYRSHPYNLPMPALSHSKREQFAQAIASGQNLLQAYRSAGYSTVGSGWKANPYKLRHAADISGRVDELLQKRRHAEDVATERAIERLALTKEALARESYKGCGDVRARRKATAGVMDHRRRHVDSLERKFARPLGRPHVPIAEHHVRIIPELLPRPHPCVA
jgi:hypothetical protein